MKRLTSKVSLRLFTNRYSFFLILLFILTRLYIWIARPTEFTDVVHNFMAYAHAWDRGEVPYLTQWYEYPPGTIPLFYLPHLFDRYTLNSQFHLDYAESYRALMLLFDLGLFILIWKFLRKTKVKSTIFYGAIIYYFLITAKAHHFVYDKIDWAFAAVTTLSVAAPLLSKSPFAQSISWIGYFTGVSLKLVNAPLGLVYAYLQRHSPKRLIIAGTITFFLTWAVPLALFRSSLQVMFVYHRLRGLQIESAGAVITSTINRFTHTEEIIEAYKNFEITGPISTSITKVVNIVFPISLLLYLLYSLRVISRSPRKVYPLLYIYLTEGYFFIFMLTSKVLSTPFILWHVPLLALYPFKSLKTQLSYTIPSFTIIAISMTRINDVPIGPFSLHLFIGWARTLLFAYLFILWHRQRNILVRKVS